MYGRELRVRGLVQGVGFRPTVWRLARECHLDGEVLNDSRGVLVRVWGDATSVGRFVERLWAEAPPLAQIQGIEETSLEGRPPAQGFRIAPSRSGEVHTGVVPDAATCAACQEEVFDPSNRRFRYPFTNCTHCGPRLSIVRSVPYDRAHTSMSVFPLCAACRAEYEDPSDRRFHAQPNACPDCGPRLWLEGPGGRVLEPRAGEDVVSAACRLIGDGHILAIKGIGGFHLACDAGNAVAVTRLRRRKHRYDKPFALMVGDIDAVRRYARLSAPEQALLESPADPIVVLGRIDGPVPLAADLAPGQDSLGIMLPYAPVHHLLMAGLERPIVLTSGNRSEEPQCTANPQARKHLAGIADFWLMHDREIVNRLDDSVVRVIGGRGRMLRRARGYAPAPVLLPPGFEAAPRVLAMGGELKNTFCMLRDGQAIVSQHIGDLEQAPCHADYRTGMALYRRLFGFVPQRVAVDAHPDYLSTQWGEGIAAEAGIPLQTVQHHHAHIASYLAEHGVERDTPPVLGVVLDGLGLGGDGGLWGSEFLRADYSGYERLAHFEPVALTGGARAMREPWRNTYAHLVRFVGWAEVQRRYGQLPIVRYLSTRPLATLDAMVRRGVNAPLAASAGRLFDALAAALGLCRDQASYEGQAAIELEALAASWPGGLPAGYGHALSEDGRRIGWGPLWRALLEDLAREADPRWIAACLHGTVSGAVVETVCRLCTTTGLDTVVLSGGVFQNRLLLEAVERGLGERAYRVLSPARLPANDGGLSLGQTVVAAARCLCAAAGPGSEASPTSR